MRVWLAYAALGLVWGTSWMAADAMANQVPPYLAAAARFSLAALVLLLAAVLRRSAWPQRRDLFVALLLSFTMVVLPSVLLLWVRDNLPSATVSVVFAAMPLAVVLLTPFFESREVPGSAMYAAIAGLGGIIFATGVVFSFSQAVAAAVAFLAMASTGISALIIRRDLAQANPVAASGVALGGAACQFFLLSLLLERGRPVQWDAKAQGAVLFLAVVAGAPAYACYFWLLRHLRAHQAVTLQWIEPVIAIVESAVLLHIGLSPGMAVGSLVAAVSAIILLRAGRKDDESVSLFGI